MSGRYEVRRSVVADAQDIVWVDVPGVGLASPTRLLTMSPARIDLLTDALLLRRVATAATALPFASKTWRDIADMLAGELAQFGTCPVHPSAGARDDCLECRVRTAMTVYRQARG